MSEEHKHGKSDHDHDHERSHQGDPGHSHEHGHEHSHEAHPHSHPAEHGHGHSHEQGHDHAHEPARDHDHDHSHGHEHEHKTRFHDPTHAAEFDRRALSGIRSSLTDKLIEMLTLKGDELVLDLATGTGRVARPLAKQIQNGRIVGVDQAKAMLDVGHRHEDPIPHYAQSAGEAD
jgi:2-polyprenyl-3-methyl-5-hydroxy-6-metoxy-1,4-benzoquinol methylase